jgi:geranylgeranyl reductase family protein
MEVVDVLVIGAGPGGCTAARVAAEKGAQVLLVERRPCIGLPVQCAEYVPTQIVQYAPLVKRCIAQRIRELQTRLPDGECVATPAAGYVIDRGLFDRSLAVAAYQAGARLWTSVRAEAQSERGVVVRKEGKRVEIGCRVVIGADGPRSTVGRWVGQENKAWIDAIQVQVVLDAPVPGTRVYFDPLYRGGYGWLFPKGDTANVGVGVSRRLSGDPHSALAHLLQQLEIKPGAIVARTAGRVPSGGAVERLRCGNVLLVGDAAGHTHPITGAGIAAAVIGGTLAGRAAAQAVLSDDLGALDSYGREWNDFMAGPLRHALSKRHYLDQHWSDDAATQSALVRETWIAFRAYGRRLKREKGS